MQSLGETNLGAHLAIAQQGWRLSDAAIAKAQGLDGIALIQNYCATCHTADGLARRTWKSCFKRLPPDFVVGPFIYAPSTMPSDMQLHRIAEITKFGLAGTDMAGHEYLPDGEVAAIAAQVVRLAKSQRHEGAVDTN